MLSKIFRKVPQQLHSNASAFSFAINKKLLYGITAREKICEGIDKLVKTVETTYGPRGRNVIIQQPYGMPKITKDGVTVAKSIDLKDAVQNIGCSLVKQAANKTNDDAGDGTTCCCVLTRAILKEGVKNVQAGVNPIEIKRGIDAAVNKVLEALKE